MSPTKTVLAVTSALLLLSGCARHVAMAPPAAVPLPITPPPRPVLADGLGAVVPPARLADGRYATINAGIDAEQTVWHLRAALNVAAIGCRGPADAGLAPGYNAMLAGKKAVLARANAHVEAAFRARGAGWQDAHDAYMTRLYNFFAMPAAKAAFCTAADAVAGEAVATDPAAFAAFAQTALPRLEAPFTAVFAAVDGYHAELAAWDARYGPDASAVRLAAATTAASPRLAYADLPTVIAWSPRPDQALAMR